MLEKTVETYLVDRVRAAGGDAYKFTSPARVSVPDRIVVFPPARIYFVELKRPGGKLTRGQEREHERLRALGCDVRVIDSREAVDAFVREASARRAGALTDEHLATLKQAALTVTPQDIDGAERIESRPDGSYITCPACEGEGCIPFESDYCNYDHVAIGVQFYGVGTGPGAAEAYFRAAKPATILALLDRLERAESILAAAPASQPAAAVSSEQRSAINDAARVLEQNWEHATADRLREAFSIEAKAETQPEQRADWRADFERQISAVGFDISREEFGGEYRHSDSANAFRWYYTGRLDEACSGAHSTQPAPSPADERAAWDGTRHSLAIAMCGFATRSGSRDLDAAISVLDAITEAGSPLSWLRTARAASANETGGAA